MCRLLARHSRQHGLRHCPQAEQPPCSHREWLHLHMLQPELRGFTMCFETLIACPSQVPTEGWATQQRWRPPAHTRPCNGLRKQLAAMLINAATPLCGLCILDMSWPVSCVQLQARGQSTAAPLLILATCCQLCSAPVHDVKSMTRLATRGPLPCPSSRGIEDLETYQHQGRSLAALGAELIAARPCRAQSRAWGQAAPAAKLTAARHCCAQSRGQGQAVLAAELTAARPCRAGSRD